MSREESKGKSILAAGAATAFCGLTLYAVGKTLLFPCRDVDPERIEKDEIDEIDSNEKPCE